MPLKRRLRPARAASHRRSRTRVTVFAERPRARAASLQLGVNDQGNTGTGGPLSDTDTVNITVVDRTLQFSLSSFTASEAQSHTTINVTLLGGAAQRAAVKVQSLDSGHRCL